MRCACSMISSRWATITAAGVHLVWHQGGKPGFALIAISSHAQTARTAAWANARQGFDLHLVWVGRFPELFSGVQIIAGQHTQAGKRAYLVTLRVAVYPGGSVLTRDHPAGAQIPDEPAADRSGCRAIEPIIDLMAPVPLQRFGQGGRESAGRNKRTAVRLIGVDKEVGLHMKARIAGALP